MNTLLPINLDDLLHARTVESPRIEFKASWYPDTTGHQVLKTICAFANDFHNLNGGYVVLGVAEHAGVAQMPPAGLSPADVAAAGRWIRGNCNRIDPVYQPILSPEVVHGRHILVLWVPASDTRPHNASDGPRGRRRYWVRLGSETVDAEANGLLRAVIDQAARVPWDERRAPGAETSDLQPQNVRSYLREVRSALADEPDALEVYRRMRLVVRANGREVPRNVALLFFADDPERWFRGARIDVVEFPEGPAGSVLVENLFQGGLVTQVRNALRLLDGLRTRRITKRDDSATAHHSHSYPEVAVREAVVNAVYHRGYDADTVEPTKVYLYPDRMEITSYPGPVPGIEAHHFRPGASAPSTPARNRRIGEFLKEIRLAEARLTGIGKIMDAMAWNGSPPPRFDFDGGRTYFRVTLPLHPDHSGA